MLRTPGCLMCVSPSITGAGAVRDFDRREHRLRPRGVDDVGGEADVLT